MLRGFITGIVLGLAALGSAKTATIYVPDDYPTIQVAIDAAINEDTVIVRPGIYFENIDFLGKVITVMSEQGCQVTTIDGNRNGSTVSFVSREGKGTVLDGFTITNGTGTYHATWGYIGGGVYCNGSSPTIKNNLITMNACDYGGGIECADESSGLILNNTITGNTASGYYNSGASAIGTYNRSSPTISNNKIFNNTSFGASSCGAIALSDYCSPLIIQNDIWGNTAEWGAGIFSYFSSSPTISGNKIYNNTAYHGGGGICCYFADKGTIVDNFIYGNNANTGGAIILLTASNTTIVNNLIYDNHATSYGGAIYCENYCSPVFANNTIFENSAGQIGGGMYCYKACQFDVSNSIFFGNTALNGTQVGLEDYSDLAFSHSDVEGGETLVFVGQFCQCTWGSGMIDADPLFADVVACDFHLTWNSPCKDTGDSSAVFEGLDFEGDPRIAGSAADMGADEFHTHLYYLGEAAPALPLDIKVIGTPGVYPVRLALGYDVLDPPLPTPYGDLYLALPPVFMFPMGGIPANGVLFYPTIAPLFWNPGEEKPFQALVGPLGDPASVLTNLMLVEVE